MTKVISDSPAGVPLSLALHVEAVCTRFEEAWKDGQQPRIEDYLSDLPEPGQSALVYELLRIEVHHRRLRGEMPRTSDYHDRFPGFEPTWIDRAVATSAVEAPARGETPSELAPRRSGSSVETTREDPIVPGYEIVGVLGRGGMGVVYKARHLPLNRLVALKMILAGAHAGPEELARFRREAEAVAQLQHAHIVQIYEIGEHQGRPYLALEYVDGGSLGQKIAGTPQPPRSAAQMVEILSRAMQHAHSRGVLHRDLKPSNILLQKSQDRGQESEVTGQKSEEGTHRSSSADLCSLTSDFCPKITDFGLAKRLDAEVGQTQSGALVGTPSYMAPEQAEGKMAGLGPATDVYALGAILYELLTGRPPFRAATMVETLDQVRTQDPVAPTQLQPKLPRDLETICLKCLHKDARKRYATAQALGDELERFLKGEPIHARPTPAWEIALKWVRRRPAIAALIGVSGVAAALLIGTLAISNVRIGHEKNRADENYHLAEARRQAAEASLQTALDAVERMLTRVGSPQLARVPQTEGLRRRLLQDALDLQLKLLDDNGTDPAVRLRTGRGHRALAGIYEMRGDFEEAKTHYDRAQEVLQKLVEEAPGLAAYQHQLALVYRDQGKLLFLRRSRHAEARAAYTQAMQLFQELVDAHPDVALYRAELAKSQTGWCAVAKVLGDHEAADDVYQQTEKLLVPLVAAFPGEEDHLWQLASLYHNRGDGFYRRGRLREAEEPTRKAVEMLETLLTKAPDVPAYRRDQVNSLVALGMTLIANGKASEAEPFLRRGRKLVDKLIANYPTVLGYKNLRSSTLHWLGRMFRAMGRLGEAEEALSEAVQTWRNLVKQYPREPAHRHRLAMSLLRLGGICRDRGRLDEAYKILSEALDLYSQHVREFPRDVGNHHQLAATWHSVGTVVFRQKNYTKAEEAFGQALAILEPLSAKAPAVPAYRRDLANTRAHLGKTLLASGRSEGAARAFAQALAGWRELVAAEPGSSDYRNGLAETLAEMGHHEGAVKEAAELVRIGQGQAASFYDAADVLAVCVRTVLADTSVPEAQRRELAQGYADQAMDLLRKAIAKGYQGIELLKNDPDLDSLRCRDDFKKLLSELEEKVTMDVIR